MSGSSALIVAPLLAAYVFSVTGYGSLIVSIRVPPAVIDDLRLARIGIFFEHDALACPESPRLNASYAGSHYLKYSALSAFYSKCIGLPSRGFDSRISGCHKSEPCR